MGLEFYSIYNWVKVFHISFVVAWMAGLLYLPRLFVYHKENYENYSSDTKVCFIVLCKPKSLEKLILAN